MKAKEYANKFLALPVETPEDRLAGISQILADFMSEGDELRQKRNAQSEEALLSVLKEQSTKWRAFANNVNNKLGVPIIKTDGFKAFLLSKIPELEGKI